MTPIVAATMGTGYYARVRRFSPPLACLLLLATVALAVAVPLVAAGRSAASAEESSVKFTPYLRRSDGRLADPVNVIFAGEGDAYAVADLLQQILNWTPIEGSDMAFFDHGQVRWADTQLGTITDGGVRKHIRLAGAAGDSEQWGPYTLGSVHHDLAVPCGHIGLGFNEERDALAAALRDAGYLLTWLHLENDGPVPHCDGTVSHGDGWAVVIHLRPDRTSTPTATPTATATPSPTVPPTVAPSPSPVPTPESTPTPTPTPTVTPEAPILPQVPVDPVVPE